VVLEAMALAKPIIASGVGAIPEMLEGKCGLVIKPRDINSLTSALGKLMNDVYLSSEIGSNAYKKVHEQYGIDKIMRDYEEIWLE